MAADAACQEKLDFPNFCQVQWEYRDKVDVEKSSEVGACTDICLPALLVCSYNEDKVFSLGIQSGACIGEEVA